MIKNDNNTTKHAVGSVAKPARFLVTRAIANFE